MAKRRMFMENLIESDEFCSLPHSSQALYFHLNMAADDDGMVGNPQRIMRSLRITKRSFDQLLESGYIIGFESGVVVITHWLSNNNIRKDRYTPTRFKNEFSSLKIQDEAMYIKASSEISADILPQNRNQNAPQVSIGKDSLVEDREVELRKDEFSVAEERLAEFSKAEASEDEPREGEIREEKERIVYSLSEKEINKEKESSEEDSFENDKSFSVSLLDEEKPVKTERDRFVSTVKLHLMTEYKTIDDKGFIDYYERRGWIDENNKVIIASYKKYLREWMDKHK